MPTPAHDRFSPPAKTAHLPRHIRWALVCLEAHLQSHEDLPTQRCLCPCSEAFNLGSWLKRQYADARAGRMGEPVYEYLRALGVLFPLGDARSTDSPVVIREKAIHAIPYQSPDYRSYRSLVWDDALRVAIDAAGEGVDLNRRKVDKFDKNSPTLDLLLYNVRNAHRAGDLPSPLVVAFTNLGLCLDQESLTAYRATEAYRTQQMVGDLAVRLREAKEQGLDLADVLTQAVVLA